MPVPVPASVPRPPGAPQVRWPLPVRIGAAIWMLLFAGYVTWLFTGTSDDEPARDLWLYTVLLFGTAAMMTARAVLVARERAAWVLLAAAITVWTCADFYYTAVVAQLDPAPFPSLADYGYLLSILPAYVAVVVLLRRRIYDPPPGLWLDGLLVACGVGAFLSLTLPAVAQGIDGGPVAVLMSVATPGSDLVLACVVAGVLGVLGVRAGATWWLLFAGAVMLWAVDSVWLLEQASHEYAVGAPLDVGWLLSFALMALAAWQLPVPPIRAVADQMWSPLPIAVAVACFALLVSATLTPLPPVTVGLAVAAVVVGVGRSTLALRSASVHSELRKQAYLDDLTGLANRRKLTVTLGGDLAPVGALLLLDIDGFKQVNDSLGHAAGDEVLRQLAPRFAAALRGDDVVARLGGDEFAFFLAGTADPGRALEVADRLRRAAAEPIRAHGVDLQVDVSIGVALCPQHGRTLEELLRASDAATFRAKHAHAGATVFEPGLDSADRGHLLFMQELREALGSDELVCVYQPKIDVRTGLPAGVEALVRWRHPKRGEIGPAEFLTLAEHTALIKPLTARVLETAIAQLGEWLESGLDVTMSVNLSATNLLDPHLPALVGRLMTLHRIPPEHLILEVTESMFMSDPDRAKATVDGLRELGALISIDDYGTGFSSLGQVSSLPAQELKLDMEFVTGVGHRQDLQSIVSATVLLAHGLGLQLVVEGIETAADLAVARQLDCDLAQGYHICPPMAPVDAGVWLRRRSAVADRSGPSLPHARSAEVRPADSVGDTAAAP